MGEFRTFQEVSPDESLDFLAALTTKAYLRFHHKGSTFHADIGSQSKVVTTTKERQLAFEEAGQNSVWLVKQIQDWKRGGKEKVPVADEKHPLLLSAGDVDLWIKIGGVGGERLALRTFRDIKPKGWVAPGGFPKRLEELLRPTLIHFREVQEEIIIGAERGVFYGLFGSFDKVLSKNLDDWGKQEYDIVSPNNWEHDLPPGRLADNLSIEAFGGESHLTRGVGILIDPSIGNLAVVSEWTMVLPVTHISDLVLLDGEHNKDGQLLRRPVGLFDHDGKLVAVWENGEPSNPEKFLPITWANPQSVVGRDI